MTLSSLFFSPTPYSRTSTNGHSPQRKGHLFVSQRTVHTFTLVLTSLQRPLTSTQRPLICVPADSPYIHSCFNLSTTATDLNAKATYLCPGRQSIHSLLFEPLYNGHLSITATAIKVCPNCPNNLSITAI